jgi:hypothetical protein
MITSSNSIFGIGVVLAFSLHLIIDEVSDLMERGGILNWFVKLNLELNLKEQKWYMASQVVILCLFGFIF